MATYTQNMSEGRPSALIIKFALPLMTGNIFQQLYTVVDTIVVGKSLGVDALAALGATDWTNWMMLGIIQGFTQGFAIVMAQEFGGKRMESLRQAIVNSAVLSALFAVLLMISGQIALKPLLVILHTPEDIFGNAALYLRIMFFGIPVVMLYNLLACILRSMGDSKTPLNAMLVASIANIVLDLVFVLGFSWGIAGAAIATVAAQLLSSLFCLYRLSSMKMLKFTRADFVLRKIFYGQGRRMIKLLTLGLPMAFQNAIIAVGGMIVQLVVNDAGITFIAGFTATNKLYGLLEVAATSYGYAMVTYVGQNMGARKIERIRDGMRASVIISVLTSVVITAVMLVFGKTILGWFISGTPDEVEQAMKVAYTYLVIMSVFLPILYILHVTRSAIQGMGNTLLPMISGIVEFFMRTSTALLLPRFVGENGIFFAEILAWFGADVVLVISYFAVSRSIFREMGNTKIQQGENRMIGK